MVAGVAGLEPDGLAVRGNRFVALSMSQQGAGESVVNIGIVGLESDGCSRLGDRLVRLPLDEPARLK